MTVPTPRFREIFFQVYQELPRQGPGSRACAERALDLCRNLPASPLVLDLGCGTGGQTIHLAELLDGPIVAIDNHAPSIDRLKTVLAERGLSQRVTALVADMSKLERPAEGFDLIWSEGALYSIGIDNALRLCRGLLREGGYLAFTDAVWRKDNPPREVKASFDLDYPNMANTGQVLAGIEASGLELIHHFTLPDEAWWGDFYTPMLRRIAELKAKYINDHEALMVLDQLAREPELHRRYSEYYAYEFFVARNRSRGNQPPAQPKHGA